MQLDLALEQVQPLSADLVTEDLARLPLGIKWLDHVLSKR